MDREQLTGRSEVSRNRSTEPGAGALHVAGGALLGWWRATTLDALIVGCMWFVGLYFIHVPWAPLWALVGAVCQFVPGIGTALSVCGPAVAASFASMDTGFDKLWWTLGLYAVIAIVDGLLVQPLLLKRETLVPWWAALLGPIVGGIALPPWGALLVPPLLAIVFAFRKRKAAA